MKRFAALQLVPSLLALVLGCAINANAQTTNGNGGPTDVGTYYDPIIRTWGSDGGSWPHFGLNYLPLEQVSSGAPFEYQIYDSGNAQVIANDIAQLAAAKIDFIILDFSNDSAANVAAGCSSTDWVVVRGCYVATAVAYWNAHNTWQIRYAIMAGPNGGPNNEQDGDTGNFAPAVYTDWVTNATFGGAANYYQISGLYLMFNLDGGGGACTGTCTDTNKFFWTAQSGHGQWGWNLGNASYNSVSTQVGPGWDNYMWGIGGWKARNDGLKYASDWNVAFNSGTPPRIIWIEGYNDYGEDGAIWKTDTATITYPPVPVDNTQDASGSPGGRYPESWTMPDQNITLDGYWNYTVAAICYLRNGTSTACSGGSSPYPTLPQPAPNLAVSASATASSSHTGFPATNVKDGNPSTEWTTIGYSSANTTAWIQLHFSSSVAFNTVVLMGRGDAANSFPVSFQIQVWNGSSWLTRVQETNFPQETIAGQPIAFTWGVTDNTTDVRVYATQLGQAGVGGSYYMALNEFEVLNETATATIPVLANWGFESPAQGAPNYYQSGPFTSGWTFGSSTGVCENGAACNIPQAPQGLQVGYVQNTGTMSQAITLPAGTYTLRFLAATEYEKNPANTVNVYYGANLIGTASPTSTAWTPYVTNSFTSNGSSQTINFTGTGSGGATALIDEVQIFNQTALP